MPAQLVQRIARYGERGVSLRPHRWPRQVCDGPPEASLGTRARYWFGEDTRLIASVRHQASDTKILGICVGNSASAFPDSGFSFTRLSEELNPIQIQRPMPHFA